MALRLFARQGFAAVSMRQIASEVGVQAGALYLYTPDKQTLLFDLMTTHMNELLQAWSETPKPQSPQDRLDAFARFHVHFHLARQEAVFISYMELRNLTDENFKAVELLRGQYEDALQQILIAGQSSGVFHLKDTKLATLALISMLTGVTNWYRPDGRFSPSEIADIYADMALKTAAGDLALVKEKSAAE